MEKTNVMIDFLALCCGWMNMIVPPQSNKSKHAIIIILFIGNGAYCLFSGEGRFFNVKKLGGGFLFVMLHVKCSLLNRRTFRQCRL